MSGLLSKANAAEESVENEAKGETVAEVLPAVQEGGGPDTVSYTHLRAHET